MIALVITPGAAARLLTDHLGKMMVIAVGISLLASLGGVLASYHLGLAPGACVVVALTGLFLAALLLAWFKNGPAVAFPSRTGLNLPSEN
jgi:ABC-type Mn2+/Zn2+ transport system permease subunit